jgi:hypothetical protein
VTQGQNHPRAKLSDVAIEEILRLWKLPKTVRPKQTVIARWFHTTQGHVTNIVRRRRRRKRGKATRTAAAPL